MTLTHIFVFAALAVLYGLLIPARLRGWFLLVVSVFAVYWMQPALPVRRLDFLLPTLTLAIAILVWFVTQAQSVEKSDYIALTLTVVVVLALALTRYLIPELRPTPSRAPSIVTVILGLLILGAFIGILYQLSRRWVRLVLFAQLLILLIFVVLKLDSLAKEISAFFRDLNDQSVALANANDLQWLGFSYIAFRLLHVLRDKQLQKLPLVSLREHLTYVVFFPSLVAGPIDRIERFSRDYQTLPQLKGLDAPRFTEGTWRIAQGLFKKFVIADSLALVALNNTNAEQAESTLGLWVLLYFYSFRLYLDFSGYTDIAIGVGTLFGIFLPENFNLPYFKSSITEFWQSWHITLSNWARMYVFLPLSRSMLRWKPRPHPLLIVLIAQLATMITIGLWHDILLNFVIWGAWHGVGLFIHKFWSDRTRLRYVKLADRPYLQQMWTLTGVLLTFHFVTLGWVWFSIQDFETASTVFLRLFGWS